MKTEACKLLEYFEYFCQMSSKLILIISSYTVSNLVHFFLRHGGTAAAAPPPFRSGNPALCGSCPL